MYSTRAVEEQSVPEIVSRLRRVLFRNVDLLLREIGQAMRLAHLPAMTVHTRDAAGDTPLHYAVYWGDVGAIEMLVAAGAQVDAPGEFGATPLFCAVLHGRYAAARTLFELGACAQVPSAFGTPAEAAAQSHDMRMRALFGLPGTPSA